MTRSWIKGIIGSAIFLLFSGIACAQPLGKQIVIVKSSDNSYFNQSIETLISHVDQATEIKIVMARELVARQSSMPRKALYVSLGQAAVEAVNQLDLDLRSINAYLTLEQFRHLNIKHQQTALLDQPLRRYLAFGKLLLPIKSIGLITEEKIILDKRETKLLRQLDFELNQYQVDPLNKLLPVLRRLLQQNDALLMLPRQSIYNRDSLKGVLLTSYRNRKPAISYSPAHVKSGALASIYSSPVDIGRHLAIMVNRALQERKRSGPAFEFAKFYSIATNPRVARSLGISLPPEADLRSKLDQPVR